MTRRGARALPQPRPCDGQYSSAQVASMVGVSAVTLHRWAHACPDQLGPHVVPVGMGSGSWARYGDADVERLRIAGRIYRALSPLVGHARGLRIEVLAQLVEDAEVTPEGFVDVAYGGLTLYVWPEENSGRRLDGGRLDP